MSKQSRRFVILASGVSAAVIVFMMMISSVSAGTGSLKISPALPAMVSSPAHFEIWAEGNCHAADPHIFLVMTEACYEGLTGNVKVEWSGGSVTIPSSNWTKESDGGKVPPGTTTGAGYTVSSLKDHLKTTGPVYWAFKPFLSGHTITHTHQSFNVTLPSTSPKMLVYALGKAVGHELDADYLGSDDPDCHTLFNVRVPPSIPGFVVFEPATAMVALASFGALAVYGLRRRKS